MSYRKATAKLHKNGENTKQSTGKLWLFGEKAVPLSRQL
jgi:hypothetical protein